MTPSPKPSSFDSLSDEELVQEIVRIVQERPSMGVIAVFLLMNQDGTATPIVASDCAHLIECETGDNFYTTARNWLDKAEEMGTKFGVQELKVHKQ